MNDAARPVGVFDSGLGGLTVVRQIKQLLPQENVVYFGDTARVPYGSKSREAIIQFSKDNVDVLARYQVKAVVVACNSSSSYALPALREIFGGPVIGVIEPGARAAVAATRNHRIGVVATRATVASGKYESAIQNLSPVSQVFSQACPLFVPFVEEGWMAKDLMQDVIREYMTGLMDHGIDTLVLGCTHYPLLKDAIQKVVGEDVQLIDSAAQVAGEVEEVLKEAGLLNAQSCRGNHRFLISDHPQDFERIARQFLGADMEVQKIDVST